MRLESITLTLDELGILAECENLVDTENNIIYDVRFDVTALLMMQIDVSRYPKLLELLETAIEDQSWVE